MLTDLYDECLPIFLNCFTTYSKQRITMDTQQIILDDDTSHRIYVMKFIFAIMVVFIHSEALPDLPFRIEVPWYMDTCKDIVNNVICAIAVPGFFLLSGFLLFLKKFTWIGNMKKKVRSILIPYLLINSFWIIFFKTMQSIEVTAPYFYGENYQIVGLEGFINAYCGKMPLYYPFWFLKDLFILNIFASIIRLFMDKHPVLLAIAIAAIFLNGVTFPFFVNQFSIYMFVIGGYIARYWNQIKKCQQIEIIRIGIVFCMFTIAKWHFEWNVSWINMLYLLIGILFYDCLAGVVLRSRIKSMVLWCSQFTFFIYAFHEFYMSMMKKAVMMMIPQYGMIQLLEYFLLPFVILGFCIVGGVIMKKRVTFLYCLLCGKQ